MWERVSLPKVVWYQEGPGVRNTQYTVQGVKLINVANLVNGEIDLATSDRYISEEEANGKYKHFLVDEGDLIIASSGIKVDYFDKKMGFAKKEHLPLCMNTSTIRFKTLDKELCDILYFMHYLKTDEFKTQLSRQIVGSAQLNFGPSHLAQMKIPLPPIEVQRKVAEALDKAAGLIDRKKQQIELVDSFLKDTFVHMFGDPIINPMGWKIKKFEELGHLGRGISKHRPRNDAVLLGGKYPLIQTSEISNADIYIRDYSQTYSEIGLKQSKIWNSGTLCITIAANIANTAILSFDACFPDSVVGFLTESSNILYIHFWFKFFQKIIESKATQVAQKNINLEFLREQKICVPPIALQNEFAAIVRKAESEKTKLKESLKELEILYNATMQKCFSGEMFG